MRMPRSRPGVAASLGLCVNASPSPGSASPSIPPGIEPASSESPASASSTRPRVSGPTSKLTRSRALFAERALPARASTLQTYTASPSPTLAHRAPRESNATARTAPQCAPYACDGTFERHSAGANGSRNPARGAATSDLSRPPRTASVPVASTATASTPAQRFRPTACGAPSPCSSAQLCLDTASSSFATTSDEPSGVNAKARTLDLPPVRTSLGGTSAGDRSFNVSTSNVRTVSPLGPIVARSLPSGDIAARTRSVGSAVARYLTGRYPFLASYTHRFPSAPAVIMREPSGVN